MGRRFLIAATAIDLGVSLCVVAARKFGLLDEDPYKGFLNINMLLVSSAAALAALGAVRRGRGDRVTGGLLAAVLVLLVLGEGICTVQDWLFGDRIWTVAWYDVMWVAGRCVLIVLLLRAAVGGGARPSNRALGIACAVIGVLVIAGASTALVPLLGASDFIESGPVAVALLSLDLVALLVGAVAYARGGLGSLSSGPLLSLCGLGLILSTDILLFRDIATGAEAFCLGEMGYFCGYLLTAWGTANSWRRG